MVIGHGEVKYLSSFRRATGYTGSLFTDPHRETYKMLAFGEGLAKLLDVKAIKHGFSALFAGHLPGSLQGSAMQLGGALIVDTRGTLVYRYHEAVAGDHPNIAAMLAAVSG